MKPGSHACAADARSVSLCQELPHADDDSLMTLPAAQALTLPSFVQRRPRRADEPPPQRYLCSTHDCDRCHGMHAAPEFLALVKSTRSLIPLCRFCICRCTACLRYEDICEAIPAVNCGVCRLCYDDAIDVAKSIAGPAATPRHLHSHELPAWLHKALEEYGGCTDRQALADDKKKKLFCFLKFCKGRGVMAEQVFCLFRVLGNFMHLIRLCRPCQVVTAGLAALAGDIAAPHDVFRHWTSSLNFSVSSFLPFPPSFLSVSNI